MCLGIPGQIVEVIDAAEALAVVEVGGVRWPVNISFITSNDRPRLRASAIGCWCMSASP